MSVTNNNGCIKTSSLALFALALPQISVQPQTNTFCKDSKITLTATGADYFSWNSINVGNTYSLIAVTNTIITISATNTITNCSSTISKQINITPCNEIENYVGAKNFSVKPIPANTVIFVSSLKASQFFIIDLLGKVRSEINVDKEQMVDVSFLENGCYFLFEMKSGERSKLIISH